MPVYVITGASRGLGLEWVRQLSQIAQNTVIAAVRTTSPIPSSLASLVDQPSPSIIHILQCDVGDSSSVANFSNSIGSVLGTDDTDDSRTMKIDYLINNAGMSTPQPHPNSLGLEADDLAIHMNVNVVGPARVVSALLPYMRRGSMVINISSALGSKTRALGMPYSIHTAYSISKAALNMLSVHQALDLRPYGIIVVTLDPGWVKTDLTEGEHAPMKAEESVVSMLKTIRQLDQNDSGRSFTFDGHESAW